MGAKVGGGVVGGEKDIPKLLEGVMNLVTSPMLWSNLAALKHES